MNPEATQAFFLEEMRRRSFEAGYYAYHEPSTLCTLAAMIVICAFIGGAVYLVRRYIDKITAQ